MKNMKNKIFSASLVALASLAVMSCDDYNDQFGINYKPTDTRSSAFTLTKSDYEAIANNEDNKKIAAELDEKAGTGTAYADALTAVGKDRYFTTLASPELYLPAFLTSATNYRLADEGARYVVTLNFYKDPSGYLSDFEGKTISSTELDSYDYEAAWGSGKATYLTPSTISKVPEVLATKYPDAQQGDMVVVNYAYSTMEPGDAQAEAASYRMAMRNDDAAYTSIADVLSDTDGGEYTVKGTVIATYGQGFLMNDGTGTILVYLKTTANNSVGDIVSVSGTTSQYGGFMQFPASSVVTMLERAETFSYPTPTEISGAELDAYLQNPTIQYVSYTGTLSISGYYYNIAVDGASEATGSISYPVAGVVDGSLNGQKVKVTGYMIGTSGGRYVNTMVTTVELADGTGVKYTPVGVLAYTTADETTVYNARGVVAATYARGFLMTDGTGYMLVYKSDTGCVPGDIVTVESVLDEYGGFNQFPSSAEVTKVDAGEYTLPAARVLDAAAMDAYLEAPYVGLVSYQGRLSVSGNYYNVTIDGAETAVGSLSYPENIDPLFNNRIVGVTGFAIGVSGSRYLNTMVTSIESISGAVSKADAATLYAYDGEKWNEYTADGTSVMPLPMTVYEQYGSNEISSKVLDNVAPVYLMEKLPFAVKGERAAVIYNSGELAVKEYMFSNGTWIPTPEYDVKNYVFEYLPEEGWTRATTYFNEPLTGGSTGGFEINDVTTDGLSYIWKIDASYGWKASAYVGGANHPTESWIVSPQIDLSEAVSPMLQFETAVNYWSGHTVEEFCSVFVSTDYTGDVEDAEWVKLEVTGWPDKQGWDFYTVNPVDLSQYVGNVVNIAFCYTSTAEVAPTWEVKNVKVGEAE